MKEVTREVTKTEVAYYEAIDGMRFNSAEECQKYEASAKMVVYAELKPYKLGETTCYDIYDGEGSEEYGIDIFHIPDGEMLTKLNTYRMMCDKNITVIPDTYIGKDVLIHWDYDRCYSWFDTIDEIVERARAAYKKAITPKEEKKEG